MLNLTNRENLSLTCFETSLEELFNFCKDDNQVSLDMVEDPKATVTRLRKILESLKGSIGEFKTEVLSVIPSSNAQAQRQKEITEATVALRNILTPPTNEGSDNQYRPGELKVYTSPTTTNHQSQSTFQPTGGNKSVTFFPSPISMNNSVMPGTESSTNNNNAGFFSSIFASQQNRKNVINSSSHNNRSSSNEKKHQHHMSKSKMAISASFFGPNSNANDEKDDKKTKQSLSKKDKKSKKSSGNSKKRSKRSRRSPTSSSDSSSRSSSASSDDMYDSSDDDTDDVNSDDDYYFDNDTLTYLPKDPSKKLADPRIMNNKTKKRRYLKEQHQRQRNGALYGTRSSSQNNRNNTSRSSSPSSNNNNNNSTHQKGKRKYKTETNFIHPTQYLSIGTHFFLELLARQTLAREIILYKYKPGDSSASVVNLFCTRPQLELYSDVAISDSLVGRVISSGVAVNVSPESPTETNVPRLVVPIFTTGRRTVVVGAVVLQHRVCGGCFSAKEETIVALWCELAAHLVQPPAILKGKPKPMTNVSTRVPTSLASAIDQFIPKKGKTVANIFQQNQQQSSTSHHHHNNNNNIDESLVFDPFNSVQSTYRNELWSTIALHDTLELNYKEKLDQLRKQKLHQVLDGHRANKKTANSIVLSAKKGVHQTQLNQMGKVDRYVNSSFLSSLHDITISASERVTGETGAHKFLMDLCSKLNEEEAATTASTLSPMSNNNNNSHHGSDTNNNSNSNNMYASFTKEQLISAQQIGAAGAGKALLQLIHSSQQQSNNSSSSHHYHHHDYNKNNSKKPLSSILHASPNSAEALLQTAITENANSIFSTSVKKTRRKSGNYENNDDSPSLSNNNNNILTPDELADLVDRCDVPLLVLRSVFQDVWKAKNNANPNTSSSNNNKTPPTSAEQQENQQRLSWYPSQRTNAAVASMQSSPKNHQNQNNSSTNKNDKSPKTDFDDEKNANNTNQHIDDHHHQSSKPLTGTIAKQRTTGVSESINACISTLPVVDVAKHVNRLEFSWRESIEDQRATDLHHLTHLADYSKTKHKLTVVERQKNEAVLKSDESTQRYERLKNQIGMLCSREFMVTSGAANSMANVLSPTKTTTTSSSSPRATNLSLLPPQGSPITSGRRASGTNNNNTTNGRSNKK